MSDSQPRLVEELEELVQLVDLQDIAPIELRAARREGLILPGPTEQVPVRNEILQRIDDEVIDIRLVSTFESPDARISVDLLVRYSKKEHFDVSQEVLTAFVHQVGLIAGYPYLREAVSSMSAKLGVDRMHLGLLTLSDVVEVLHNPAVGPKAGGCESKSGIDGTGARD